MGEQVRVTSLDALESLRAGLIVFMTRARQSLDHAGEEVRRTKMWLQNEQRVKWEAEVRRRRKHLEQCEGELMSARLSEFVDSPTMQQAAVRKARKMVEEAEEKIRRVKHCTQNFDAWMEPHLRKMENLRQFLDVEVPKAIAYLVQIQRTLEAYAQTTFESTDSSTKDTTS